MKTTDVGKQPGMGTRLAFLALMVGLVCAACALAAGPGYRMHVLSLSTGLQTIRWAAIGAALGGAVAICALVVVVVARGRQGRSLVIAALIINGLVAIPPALFYRHAQQLPHIHDLSTDIVDPPKFVAVLALRAGARNTVDYSPQTAIEQQRGYPDIAPLKLGTSPTDAFDRVVRAVRSMGWDVVSVAPGDLRVEASDTTLLFGFMDEVVVRVRPTGQGSVIDVRSLSRVGGSDFGVNANRVRALLRKIGEATPS